jgi:signal transduction protein with GAF and PtsI domain
MKYADTYLKLADFGRELLEKKSLEEGIPHISKYAKDVIEASRCSIFIYDHHKDSLWTTHADGVEKIEIASDKGVVGETIKEKKPVIVNDAYAHPTFLPDVDKETGYKTNNLITAPIFNSNRQIIGVLELLNKEGGFDKEDTRFMIFFAHYVSGFLELLTHMRGD